MSAVVKPAPARTTPARVDAVDLARGVALIGMMLVHLGPTWTGLNPPVSQMVAGGRSAPLFAMLAGVALTLVHRRDPRGAGSVPATLIRGVLLIGLGLALGSLNDMPVLIILAFYGLMIVVALPFRRLSTATLVVMSGAWALLSGAGLLFVEMHHSPVLAGQAEVSDLKHPLQLAQELVVFGGYPAGVWFAYILAGLVVGRLDLHRAAVAGRLVALGLTLVAATLALGWLFIRRGELDDPYELGWRALFAGRDYATDDASWNQLLLVGEHTSMPLNVLSAVGSALLVIGLCALALHVPWARLVLLPLRAAGAMTLTLYTAHVLWFWRLSSADHGSGTFSPGTYSLWLLQVVVLCAVAMVWQRFVGRGPLESVVRTMSLAGAAVGRARKNAPV